MFNEPKQIEKSKIRREMIKQYAEDKGIDEKSFEYFMDLVDDLSSCIDLKLGNIENPMSVDEKILTRMYTCGECLLSDSEEETNKLYINQYIDSVIVEYAKFGYEVGIKIYKEKLNDFTNKLYGNNKKDYYDAVVCLTKNLMKINSKESKRKKLSNA